MSDLLRTLFTSGNFEPHSEHFQNAQALMWTDIVSNIIIVVAYLSIPVALIYFVRHRKDLAFNWMFMVYAAFILACAVTHAIHAYTYFSGVYYLQGIADAMTAVISISAAIATMYIIPLALKIPNPKELAEAQQTARMREFELAKQREIDQERSEFISSASHELRTPLTSQMLFTELLQEMTKENGHAQYEEYLTRIKKQSERLSRLISDLLEIVRSEGHRIVSELEQSNLTRVAEETVREAQAINQQHTITFSGRIAHPLLMDQERIGQVIMNLIGNAAKYSPKGSTIAVTLKEFSDHAEVRVTDSGIGIDPEHHKKIFERWFRVAGSSQKSYAGMGVGLFLAAEIIKAHGGEITVESQLGKGATFVFTLPFYAKAAEHTQSLARLA